MKTFSKIWLGISLIAIGVGIAILIIAAGTGAKWRDISALTTMNGSYEGVENIDMDISYAEVTIVEGDAFSISADDVYEGEIESYVTDGTWYISEDYSDDYEIFDWDFPARAVLNWGDFAPEITITIPKDFVANNFLLKVEAGSVKADAVNARDGEFNVDTGSIVINQLTISGKSQYNVGAGNITLQDSKVNDIAIDCNIGSVDLSGIITGDSGIRCDIGRIKLELNADEADYSYNVSCDIGDVKINGKRYHSISNEIINSEEAENNLDLECNIGNITVKFN